MLCGVSGCCGLQLLDAGHVCKGGIKFCNLAQRRGGVTGSQLLQQGVQWLCGSPSHHTSPVGTFVFSAATISNQELEKKKKRITHPMMLYCRMIAS